MPSNTDDGIVVVARAIDLAAREAFITILTDEDAAYLSKVAIETYESHLRDKGMVVVPRECTEEMFVAGRSALRNNSTRTGNARVAYKAMVAAASPSHSATKSE